MDVLYSNSKGGSSPPTLASTTAEFVKTMCSNRPRLLLGAGGVPPEAGLGAKPLIRAPRKSSPYKLPRINGHAQYGWVLPDDASRSRPIHERNGDHVDNVL
jgi:hypothetical protein